MSFNKLHLISTLCILCLFISCKKDKDDVGPEILNQTEETIGEEGGSINIDELEIIFPENCFTGDYNLNIKVYDEEQDFTGNRITYVYQVENIPVDIKEPVQIKLKYASGTSSTKYIAVGEQEVLGDDFIFSMEEAVDSSGYLIYNLTVPISSILKSTDDEDFQTIIKLLGAEDYFKTPSKHFKLEYDEDNPPPMLNRLVDTLESIFDKCYTLGFSCAHKMENENAKLKVAFSNELVENYCEVNHTGFTKLVKLYINPDKLNNTDFPELSIALGREFVNTLLLYEFYTSTKIKNYVNPLDNNDNIILYCYLTSICNYSEELFVPASQRDSYVPMECKFKDYLFDMGLLHIFHPDTQIKYAQMKEYILNLTFLVKHIVNKWSFNYARNILYEMLNSDANLVKAVSDVTLIESDKWITEFYKELILGKIYGTSGNFDKTSLIEESKSDMDVSFKRTYKKASCKLFRVNTQKINIENNSIMNITSQAKTLAFSLNRNNNTIKFLEEGTDFSVSNIKSLADENKDILLAVVYTDYLLFGDDHEIEVKAKIETNNFLACKVVYLVISGIMLEGDYTKWTDEDWCVGKTWEDESFYIESSLNIKSISGTQVTAEKHVDDGYCLRDCYITITFRDTEYDYINSFNYEETYKVPHETMPIDDEYKCTAGNIEKIREYSEEGYYSRTFEKLNCTNFEFIKWVESGHRWPCYEMTATDIDCIDPKIMLMFSTP